MAIRGYGIWRWQHAHIDDDIVQRRLMFDAALRRERGIGIADLVAICSLVQLTCTGKASMGLFATRHRISRREVNLTQGGQQVANTVLDVLAESPDSFATLCRPLLSARGVVQPDLSPIEHIPILRDGDGFSVMSPLHVSLRGLWLPVQTMGETGLSLFGDVQEAYLHGLLSALYGDRYFKVPKKTSEPSADGMIWFDDGVIVIECKATRTPKASRYMIRTDAQLNKDLMRRDFQRATIQLTATCSDIVSGKLHHDACKRPRVIVPVILCFDVVPMSVFASDVLGAILSLEVPAYDALRVLQPQLLLIDDIERLTSANAGALLETCKRRHGTVHRFESIERYFRHVPGAKMRMIETLIQLIRTDVSTLFQDAMAAEDKKAGK
jgi:hypothetical protein